MAHVIMAVGKGLFARHFIFMIGARQGITGMRRGHRL
jgi:hypothetical protein